MCRDMIGWMEDPETLKLSFETIYGDYGKEEQYKTISKICSFLNIDAVNVDLDMVLGQTLGVETKTWSGSRSKIEMYWNDEIEAKFVALGGKEMNKVLGYG